MRRQWRISAIVLTVCIVGVVDLSFGQSILGQGEGSSVGRSSFGFSPSISVSERFDSNVFFRPASPGLKREDYVTRVSPSLRINHNGDYADGYLNMGAFSETYVNNPGLNYIGSNGSLSFNLDNTVKKLLPRASLTVTDSVFYSPTPPGFINPEAGTRPDDPANIDNIFARGLLTARTNRISNNGTVSASYATSVSTSLNASYSHAFLKFLDALPGGVFDTTTQTGSVGGTVRLTALDTVTVNLAETQSSFTNGSASSFFMKSDRGTVGWSRTITPNISAQVGGGGVLFNNGRSTYLANASLAMKFSNHSATVSYARSVFPSFVGVATQVVGDVVSLSVVHNISQRWQLSESANYSHSSGFGGGNAIRFDSYGGSANLSYSIDRNWSTSLTYNYMKFNRESGAVTTEFDRHAVIWSVNASWR
jgi:hypothetical protein